MKTSSVVRTRAPAGVVRIVYGGSDVRIMGWGGCYYE